MEDNWAEEFNEWIMGPSLDTPAERSHKWTLRHGWKVWKDGHGIRHRWRDMEETYLSNVAGWIERRAALMRLYIVKRNGDRGT